MSIPSRIARGIALMGLGLVGGTVSAHVGQTAPAKWMLRLEQKSESGKPTTTKTYAWKVPLATFNRRYDDSLGSPLAQVITNQAPDSSAFTPLWMTVPPTMSAVCMKGATLEFTSDTSGYLCDSSGALAHSGGVPAPSADSNWRNYLFGVGMYAANNPNCVAVTIAKSSSCATGNAGAGASFWDTAYWNGSYLVPGTSGYYDENGNWISTGSLSDNACTVTVSGPGVGTQSLSVPGSLAGTTVTLGDMWYYGKTANVGGQYFCQEGLNTQSCGTAGGPSKCAYFGVADGISKGVNLPLDRESIVSASRAGMPLLKSQSYGWMRSAMQREQLMNGYFTHILTGVKLLTSQNNTNDITKWASEDVEVQWTVYTDNTPAAVADTPGRNTPSSYGDVLIRRASPTAKIASGSMLLCRYQSHTSEFLPSAWAFPKTGYLTCGSWKPPTAEEAAAGNTQGTLLNANIFADPAVPDSIYGLNLNNAYDDRSNDDPVQCALSPEMCVPPFNANGGGDRLIKEVILPLVSKYDAQSAVLNYLGAPIFTELNRQWYTIDGGPEYVNTTTVSSGAQSRLVQYFDPADLTDPAKMRAGQSFQITGRSVNFPNCGTGPITMTQNWVWDAQNAVPELNWDAYRVFIQPTGSYQIIAQYNTGDGTVPTGNGLLADPSKNASSTRSGVSVPFSVAMMVPSAWRGTVDYYWNQKVYGPDDLHGEPGPNGEPGPVLPGATVHWRDLFYPQVKFVSPPGPGQFDGPYFVMDPMEYPPAHPGYKTVLDAHLYDGRTPLNAPALSTSLNHTFRSAPQNGTVSGAIDQNKRELVCDTKGTSQCCIDWQSYVNPVVCDKDGVCTGGDTVWYCAKFGDPYDTCASYHCKAYYCEWGSNDAQSGFFELGSNNYSCGGWSQLDSLNASYAANLCVLPYSYNGMQEPVQSSNSLSSYLTWKERGVRANWSVPNPGSTVP